MRSHLDGLAGSVEAIQHPVDADIRTPFTPQLK